MAHEDLYGKVIHRDDKVVVRMSINGDGEYLIKVHPITQNGQEGLPRGYMLGSNALSFTPKPVKEEGK